MPGSRSIGRSWRIRTSPRAGASSTTSSIHVRRVRASSTRSRRCSRSATEIRRRSTETFRSSRVVFSKVLIANRGEIALRVIRACRELGVRTVVVFSDADARAPHVRAADEAYNVGAAPSAESYLRGERIIEVARRAGAEAIHPGYGFLSEREWFARAVRDAGLVFVGPPAEAITAMGSKTAARRLGGAAGDPVGPGTRRPLRDEVEGHAMAERFGYPVLLKAAAGGGGKGMRVVHTADARASSLAQAQREAKSA